MFLIVTAEGLDVSFSLFLCLIVFILSFILLFSSLLLFLFLQFLLLCFPSPVPQSVQLRSPPPLRLLSPHLFSTSSPSCLLLFPPVICFSPISPSLPSSPSASCPTWLQSSGRISCSLRSRVSPRRKTTTESLNQMKLFHLSLI